MGEAAPVKYPTPGRLFTYSIRLRLYGVLALKHVVPINVEDIVRWGVWLGRHIC